MASFAWVGTNVVILLVAVGMGGATGQENTSKDLGAQWHSTLITQLVNWGDGDCQVFQTAASYAAYAVMLQADGLKGDASWACHCALTGEQCAVPLVTTRTFGKDPLVVCGFPVCTLEDVCSSTLDLAPDDVSSFWWNIYDAFDDNIYPVGFALGQYNFNAIRLIDLWEAFVDFRQCSAFRRHKLLEKLFAVPRGSDPAGMDGMNYAEFVSRLFRFEPQPSFKQFHKNGLAGFASSHYHPEKEARAAAWWRYMAAVGDSLKNEPISTLLGTPHLLQFIHYGAGRQVHSPAIVQRAKDVNGAIANALLAVPEATRHVLAPSLLPADGCSTLACNHVLSLTTGLSAMEADGVPIAKLNVVEVGAGFGNMINVVGNSFGFSSWTIFDMAFVERVQEWVVNKTLPGVKVYRNAPPSSISPPETGESWVNLVDTESLRFYNMHGDVPEFDLLIATHSLSELSYTDFEWYAAVIAPKARYMIYSYSQFPSKECNERKLQTLLKHMHIVWEGFNESRDLVLRNNKFSCSSTGHDAAARPQSCPR